MTREPSEREQTNCLPSKCQHTEVSFPLGHLKCFCLLTCRLIINSAIFFLFSLLIMDFFVLLLFIMYSCTFSPVVLLLLLGAQVPEGKEAGLKTNQQLRRIRRIFCRIDKIKHVEGSQCLQFHISWAPRALSVILRQNMTFCIHLAECAGKDRIQRPVGKTLDSKLRKLISPSK